MDEDNVVVVEPEKEPAPKKPADVYLRLEGIYEGDVKVTPTQESHAFMFHFNDLSGNGYLCPVYCEENQRDGVRKMLRRIKPLVLVFSEPTQAEKEESVPVPLQTAPSKAVH